MEKSDIWFGLVEVQPLKNNFDLQDASGAFVNVAYKATSKKHFVELIIETFKEYNFNVVEIEDIECYSHIEIDDKEESEKIESV